HHAAVPVQRDLLPARQASGLGDHPRLVHAALPPGADHAAAGAGPGRATGPRQRALAGSPHRGAVRGSGARHAAPARRLNGHPRSGVAYAVGRRCYKSAPMRRRLVPFGPAIFMLALAAPASAADPLLPSPPPPTPAPAEAKLSVGIATKGITDHHKLWLLAGDKVKVRGTLTPYVDGQVVVVKLFKGGKQVGHRNAK